jgi:hypothetical protein
LKKNETKIKIKCKVGWLNELAVFLGFINVETICKVAELRKKFLNKN